jgi:hypothetical protein
MKLPISLFTALIALIAASLAQSSSQSSPDKPPHSMQQDSQPASLASSLNEGSTKLTGCIRSESGKYLLEGKRHKKIWLSGPVEFAPHTGHAVILHGSFLNGSASSNTSPGNQHTAAEPSATRQESNFQVAKIEMVSDTCTLKNTKGIKGSSDQP